MSPPDDKPATTPRPLASERFWVVMGDTDAARIIYFAAPLHWAERLATNWMRQAGLPLAEMLTSGNGMPAVRAEANYHGPLRLDDEVEASLWLHDRSRSALTLRTTFRHVGEDRLAAEVLLTKVYVEIGDGGIHATPMPEQLLAALEN